MKGASRWLFVMAMLAGGTAHGHPGGMAPAPPKPGPKAPRLAPSKPDAETFLTRKANRGNAFSNNPGTRCHRQWKRRRRGAKDNRKKRRR